MSPKSLNSNWIHCIALHCAAEEFCCIQWVEINILIFHRLLDRNVESKKKFQIESNSPATKDQEPQMFPDISRGNQESVITCILLTPDFLIYSTDVRIASNGLLYHSFTHLLHFSWAIWHTFRWNIGQPLSIFGIRAASKVFSVTPTARNCCSSTTTIKATFIVQWVHPFTSFTHAILIRRLFFGNF